MKAVARWPWMLRVPTKMAKARRLEIDRDAIRIATAKEKTIPTLAKVRSIPEAIPNTWGGEAFMTAAVLAGKKLAVQIGPVPGYARLNAGGDHLHDVPSRDRDPSPHP